VVSNTVTPSLIIYTVSGFRKMIRDTLLQMVDFFNNFPKGVHQDQFQKIFSTHLLSSFVPSLNNCGTHLDSRNLWSRNLPWIRESYVKWHIFYPPTFWTAREILSIYLWGPPRISRHDCRAVQNPYSNHLRLHNLNTLSECILGCESVWIADHDFRVLAYTPYGENLYKLVCELHRFQWIQVAKMAQCFLIKLIANFLRHSCLDSAVITNLQFGIPVSTGMLPCLSLS